MTKHYFRDRGWHWQFGWLRRSELDDEELGFCYEHPDGDLIYSTSDDHNIAMSLEKWYDPVADEEYLRLAKTTAPWSKLRRDWGLKCKLSQS